ncbi:phosphatidylinositol transfer protein csr1 [Coemansia biformis]|uniref:Phosphatidylinositol transfer protein csr1 n=1 Tax=Coemansia biformis TaxID=1286918 RepID=A0A9W8CVJ5_9FUNG|nr:phosphatidylinositol transfer protein csr1 [Coemansia biformis]
MGVTPTATGATSGTSAAAAAVVVVNVVEQYEKGTLNLAGTLGHLDHREQALLRALWRKLLEVFKDNKPALAAASKASGDGSATTAKRSERALRQNAKPLDTAKSSGGWFGFGASTAKSEPIEYRQTVSAVAPASSQPPAFAADGGIHTIRDAFWAATLYDHPDVMILRFLRARKWKVDEALEMLVACLRWRVEEEVDWLIWHGELALNHGLLRRGIGAVHKSDRLGQPVLHIPVRMNDPSAQPREQIVDYTIFLMEVARSLLHPPVEKVCLLFDTTDMSISNMDWAFFRTFLNYLEHYYPECLGVVIIYNASWVFNKLWKLICPLLDPVVASKVNFVNSAAELQKFIAPDALPTEFGGASVFKYDYMLPVAGENNQMHDDDARLKAAEERRAECAEFERVTAKWASLADGAPVDGLAALDDERGKAADRLVAISKTFDNSVRARTLYHRTGVIDSQLVVHL